MKTLSAITRICFPRYFEILLYLRRKSFILFFIVLAVSSVLAPFILLVSPFKVLAALRRSRARLDEEKKREKMRKHENDLYPLW